MKYSILGEEKICQIYKDTEKALDKTVGHIVQLLDREKQTVATAESCTGGLLSQLITSVSGASRVFELGICTYAERMKTKFLGVPAELIAEKGVVSAEVAMAMAHGLRQQSAAALCLSVTGIAGPDVGTPCMWGCCWGRRQWLRTYSYGGTACVTVRRSATVSPYAPLASQKVI